MIAVSTKAMSVKSSGGYNDGDDDAGHNDDDDGETEERRISNIYKSMSSSNY